MNSHAVSTRPFQGSRCPYAKASSGTSSGDGDVGATTRCRSQWPSCAAGRALLSAPKAPWSGPVLVGRIKQAHRRRQGGVPSEQQQVTHHHAAGAAVISRNAHGSLCPPPHAQLAVCVALHAPGLTQPAYVPADWRACSKPSSTTPPHPPWPSPSSLTPHSLPARPRLPVAAGPARPGPGLVVPPAALLRRSTRC